MKRHKPKKYCECGHPQSSPIPHAHSRDAEKMEYIILRASYLQRGEELAELRKQNAELANDRELLHRIHGRPFSHKLDMQREITTLKNVLRYIFNNVVMCKGEVPPEAIKCSIKLFKGVL